MGDKYLLYGCLYSCASPNETLELIAYSSPLRSRIQSSEQQALRSQNRVQHPFCLSLFESDKTKSRGIQQAPGLRSVLDSNVRLQFQVSRFYPFVLIQKSRPFYATLHSSSAITLAITPLNHVPTGVYKKLWEFCPLGALILPTGTLAHYTSVVSKCVARPKSKYTRLTLPSR